MKNKNKSKKNIRTVPKSNRKIVERGKIDTTNTQIRDLSIAHFPGLVYVQALR